MSARNDYPRLASFGDAPSGHDADLIAKRAEARQALYEIERLRKIKTWDDTAYEHVAEMCNEQLRDIQRLEAEIEHLRGDSELLRLFVQGCWDAHFDPGESGAAWDALPERIRMWVLDDPTQEHGR
jgi:hypothetical protein